MTLYHIVILVGRRDFVRDLVGKTNDLREKIGYLLGFGKRDLFLIIFSLRRQKSKIVLFLDYVGVREYPTET
jgi:hypothetical protein